MLSRLPSKCKECKVRFTDEERAKGNPLHPACIPAYADKKQRSAIRKQTAAVKKAKKAEKAADKVKREAMKSPRDHKKVAQRAFNAFIRARDAHLGCVSCGEMNPPMKPGGQWDAGHFLGRGAYPELAFDEDNCHKQCKSCNAGSGKFSHKARTVAEKYEEELRTNRIGNERVDRLKGPHEPRKYKSEDYEALTATYRAKLRDLPRMEEAA